MAYVVKAELAPDAAAGPMRFREKTMYRGKDIRPGDEVFVFASENQGGAGLCAKGLVTSVEHGPGIRITIEVRPLAAVRQGLGRRELKPFCDLTDGRPQAEIARKLYRQATNKIAGVSDEAAGFLESHF